jgi:serine/threonine protein phosphatase 1
MGDVHGNLHAFNQCIERSGFNSEEDTLVQLGDVSDRYPDTAKVVEKLMEIPKLIAIRGNHDEWTMNWFASGVKNTTWIFNGGAQTIESYSALEGDIDIERHKKFFVEIQQDFYIDSNNRIFVHGGFENPKGPAYDADVSNCRWDRELWISAMEGEKIDRKPELLQGFNEIYIGHTPTLNWFMEEPMRACNVWNMDTGVATTGKLTIMDIETKEFWQSDHSNELYKL